jgi:hypothetical protein
VRCDTVVKSLETMDSKRLWRIEAIEFEVGDNCDMNPLIGVILVIGVPLSVCVFLTVEMERR